MTAEPDWHNNPWDHFDADGSTALPVDDKKYIHKFACAVKPEDATGWIFDRLENSLRQAKAKTGTDRRGWLEDAAFYTVVLEMMTRAKPTPH